MNDSATACAGAVCAGLTLRMLCGAAGVPHVLGGPALYAALGALDSGLFTRLCTAVGKDLDPSERSVLGHFDESSASLIETLARPMLSMRSPLLLGDSGKVELSDDPCLWRSAPTARLAVDGHPLIFANGDPQWLLALLERNRPSLVFLDAHSQWLAMRPREFNACLLRADLVTITEREYRMLPRMALSGCTLGQGSRVLIVKKGEAGVRVTLGGQGRDLPAPRPAAVKCDVGCGDFLIGALAGALIQSAARSAADLSLDRVEAAYLAALPRLTRLLESDSPRQFVSECLAELVGSGVGPC